MSALLQYGILRIICLGHTVFCNQRHCNFIREPGPELLQAFSPFVWDFAEATIRTLINRMFLRSFQEDILDKETIAPPGIPTTTTIAYFYIWDATNLRGELLISEWKEAGGSPGETESKLVFITK